MAAGAKRELALMELLLRAVRMLVEAKPVMIRASAQEAWLARYTGLMASVEEATGERTTGRPSVVEPRQRPPREVMHYGAGVTDCGRDAASLPPSHYWNMDHAATTCGECKDAFAHIQSKTVRR
jgi:hypothetical protein